LARIRRRSAGLRTEFWMVSSVVRQRDGIANRWVARRRNAWFAITFPTVNSLRDSSSNRDCSPGTRSPIHAHRRGFDSSDPQARRRLTGLAATHPRSFARGPLEKRFGEMKRRGRAARHGRARRVGGRRLESRFARRTGGPWPTYSRPVSLLQSHRRRRRLRPNQYFACTQILRLV
jgi:hypothetical protein